MRFFLPVIPAQAGIQSEVTTAKAGSQFARSIP
jgi:hypothetical protein